VSVSGTLRGVLLEHYGRQPGRLCVRCLFPDGSRQDVTYAGLVERGSALARRLDEREVPPGAPVIVLLPHSADLYCAFFGAILGGRVPSILALPSFKLDPHHYRRELEALLARVAAGAVVTDSVTAAQLELSGAQVGGAALELADLLAPGRAPVPEATAEPDDVVLLQHSSGSTGLKKGVALSNRAVLNQVEAYAPAIGLDAEDLIATWLPLYHDMGLMACAVLPVVKGVPVVALSPFHWVARPASLLQAIHAEQATLTWLPNFAFEFLAARVRDSQLGDVRLDGMRAWINCSEPTLVRSHRRFAEHYAPRGVRPETLWTCYAAAETTFAITQSRPGQPPTVETVDRERFQTGSEAVPAAAGRPGLELMSAGEPLPGTELRILDEEGRELPERRVGEIAIRSSSLFSGYFRQPQETAEVLREGWYLSGDLGYRAAGQLFITGRKKDLIIIAGKNYYPQDVEAVVSDVPGIHPGRVVALGLDDPGIGTQRLVVLAEVEDETQVESLELSGRVRAAVSAGLECTIDELRLLPRMSLLKTSSGKIARRPNLERFVAERPR
jgi:acyl-CoA synthetase (AMP-forming)/AMP-acid ligase II